MSTFKNLIIIREFFKSLAVQDRCKVVEYLGHIACGISGYLTVTREQGKIMSFNCHMCQGNSLAKKNLSENATFDKIKVEVIMALTNIMKSSTFLESRRSRVLAMIAIRKFAFHISNPEFLELEVSYLAQWCFQSLTSSIRELRVAARLVINYS